MSEKSLEKVASDVAKLQDLVEGKADAGALSGLLRASDVKEGALESSADKSRVATERFVSEATADQIVQAVKSPEVIGIAVALTLAKIELPPILSTEPVVERLLKDRGVERNDWGFLPLWKMLRRGGGSAEEVTGTEGSGPGGTRQSGEGGESQEGQARRTEEQLRRTEQQARRTGQEVRAVTSDLQGLARQGDRAADSLG
ncbi:hypothetical protein ACFZAU_07200 [Streptomyces sp. NPDC008238]